MSKPQQAELIPNNFAATAQMAARWDAARAAALEMAKPREVCSARFASWKVGIQRPRDIREGLAITLGDVALVGEGESSLMLFGDQDIEDVFAWLDDAEWLEGYPRLAEFTPDAFASLMSLVAYVGDFRPSEPEGLELPVGTVYVMHAIHQLALLRLAYHMAAAVQRLDFLALRDRFCAVSTNPTWDVPESDAELLRAAREWVGGNAMVSGVVLVPRDDGDGIPFQVGTRPRIPLQILWVAVAASIGAVETNQPAPYVCDYRPCARVFVSTRQHVRGERRFCSQRCGKRYSSTANTYAKRAAAREARTQPKE